MADEIECAVCGGPADGGIECHECGCAICDGCTHPGEDAQGEPIVICVECYEDEKRLRLARERQGEGGA